MSNCAQQVSVTTDNTPVKSLRVAVGVPATLCDFCHVQWNVADTFANQ